MPTRQDQLHSYQFTIQRVVAALVMRETDPPQSPFRRTAGATLASVMVAALALAAIGAYSLLSPAADSRWQDGTAVVVERESGARFVYRDGKLHPVANYASALLIIGSTTPKTVVVPQESIAGVPRGVPLGIAGAPDSLPAKDRLVGAPWTLCSRPAFDGRGGTRTESALFVGPDAGGGEPARGGRPLADGALLGRLGDGSTYLLWQHRRHLIREPAVVLPALGWGNEAHVALAPALLSALPAGADLARIPIRDRGKRSARVPTARIGEVFLVANQGGTRQYAVALRDGLAAVTQLQADLLIGDPLTATLVGQADARPMSQGQYALIPKVGDLLPGDETAVPRTTPALARPVSGVCAVFRDATGVADVRIDVGVPELPDAPASGPGTEGGLVVDRVAVPPGQGAIIEALPSPQAPDGTLSIVTDQGKRYVLPSGDVLGTLGFLGVQPLRLPASLAALVPAGRPLDPEAARSPVTG